MAGSRIYRAGFNPHRANREPLVSNRIYRAGFNPWRANREPLVGNRGAASTHTFPGMPGMYTTGCPKKNDT